MADPIKHFHHLAVALANTISIEQLLADPTLSDPDILNRAIADPMRYIATLTPTGAAIVQLCIAAPLEFLPRIQLEQMPINMRVIGGLIDQSTNSASTTSKTHMMIRINIAFSIRDEFPDKPRAFATINSYYDYFAANQVRPELCIFTKHQRPMPARLLPPIGAHGLKYQFLPRINNDLIIFVPDDATQTQLVIDQLSDQLLQYTYQLLGEYAYYHLGQFSVAPQSRIKVDYAVRPFEQLPTIIDLLTSPDHCAICNISASNANLSRVANQRPAELIHAAAPQITTDPAELLYCSYCSILVSNH